jgi:hypothetical protein
MFTVSGFSDAAGEAYFFYSNFPSLDKHRARVS